MKTIGIIAAMNEEMVLIKKKMEIKVTKIVVETEFYIGSLGGKSIVLVKCGIGKVNAAICTQVLIDLFAVDYIINSGIAGGIHRDMNIGDLVISLDAVQHDFNSVIFGLGIGEIPYMSTSIFPADAALIEIAQKAAQELGLENGSKVYTARIASGDEFVSSKEKKREIWNNVGGYCAEMEGAAIAQCCHLNKIPFLIIRTISDNAESASNIEYTEFAAKSAAISSQLTEKIIDNI